MKRGDAITFVTKYGDRATGVYVGPSTSPGLNGEVAGHEVRSDNCFGPDHGDLGAVRVFMVTPPTLLAEPEAATVRERLAGKF